MLSLAIYPLGLYARTFGVRTFSSFRPDLLNKSWSHGRLLFKQNPYKRKFMEVKTKKIDHWENTNESIINPMKARTAVKNNVMLYRFEKPFLYKGAFIFGVFSFIGCLAMADTVYLVLCKDLFAPGKDIWSSFLEHIWYLTAIAIGVIGGLSILYTVWYVTIRSVKYVILRKGGDKVTIVTYHPFKGEKIMNIPLKDINCLSIRDAKKGYVKIEINNYKYKYMLDKAGHFVNPELFDATVGIKRNI